MYIVFLNPPFLKRYSRESRSPAVAKSGTLYYPMWLCYAAALCKKEGFGIEVIDATPQNTSVEEIIKNIKYEPELLVVDTSTPSIYNDIKVAIKLKNSFKNCKVVLVGPHVAATASETMQFNSDIDAVTLSNYDYVVRDYAKALSLNAELSNIKGLVWRDTEGIHLNDERDEIEDLDCTPFVSEIYKEFLNIENYFYGHSKHPLIVITTGRGCNFNCSYCVLPQTMHKGKYRFRSVDHVANEFSYIYKNFPGLKEIMIEDDTLTFNRARLRSLCQKLIEKKLNRIQWSANSRADVDYETLKLMKKAGCRLLCVGFESGNQKILDNIRKGIKRSMFFDFIKNARKVGILIHGCFMVGNWGETRSTMQETLNLALALNPDTAQFFPIMVYPGTYDYERHKNAGNILSTNYRNWLTEDGLHKSVVNIPGLSYEEQVAFCDEARRRFYLRPKYLLYKALQSLKEPSELKRNIIGAKNLIKYIFKNSLSKEKV